MIRRGLFGMPKGQRIEMNGRKKVSCYSLPVLLIYYGFFVAGELRLHNLLF